MLPDYPELKDELHEVLMEWFANRIKHHTGPGLSDIHSYHIPEGRTTAFVRQDGEYDEMDLKQMGAEFEIKSSDIPRSDFNFVLAKLEESAASIGIQNAKMIFETMEEVTEKTGNVVKSKGAMTVDDYFATLEKIEIPFDDDGNPSMPRMIASEAAGKRMIQIEREIQDSPKLQERYENTMKSKWRKWLAGEAARKLVG